MSLKSAIAWIAREVKRRNKAQVSDYDGVDGIDTPIGRLPPVPVPDVQIGFEQCDNAAHDALLQSEGAYPLIVPFYHDADGLLAEAETALSSYHPDDITDDDGNLCIIVDTLLDEYSTNFAMLRLAEALGATYFNCCNECQAIGELRADCEWLVEVLEDFANDEAGRINYLLVNKARGHFYFTWHDGSFVLMYQVDAENVSCAVFRMA